MYFIKNGLGEKWKWLGGLFAIFAAITCFGTGNAVQTNAISGVLWGTFGVPTWITALILFLLIASVLLGGLRRIGSVAGKIVPFMYCWQTPARNFARCCGKKWKRQASFLWRSRGMEMRF